jgi:serine O-acetyltransferase
MKQNMDQDHLLDLLERQLKSLLAFDPEKDGSTLRSALPVALQRSEYCFSHTRNKYYHQDGETYFNPFHSGQYCVFLYYLSNTVGKIAGAGDLADRLYYLNKILNSVDLYHAVTLPAVFGLDHPLGSVMGRAVYSDGLMFMQNCTIGNNRGIYPSLGRNVTLYSGAKILGACRIGHHVTLAANACVIDQDVPDYALVFGSSPHLTIKNRPPPTRSDNENPWFTEQSITQENNS